MAFPSALNNQRRFHNEWSAIEFTRTKTERQRRGSLAGGNDFHVLLGRGGSFKRLHYFEHVLSKTTAGTMASIAAEKG